MTSIIPSPLDESPSGSDSGSTTTASSSASSLDKNGEDDPHTSVFMTSSTLEDSVRNDIPPPPIQKVSTMDASEYFFPLFYSSERRPLGIWEKQLGLGHIKRRVEVGEGGRGRFHVLELMNAKLCTGTFITCPLKEWMALHISLPHMVLVMKNYRRNFSFEVQVLDSKGFLRRFCLATWFNGGNAKKWHFLTQVPLKLEIGWNEIHVDFNALLEKNYRTTYFETVRVVVNANCRLRQIYFCSDKIINREIPIPPMSAFSNLVQLHPGFTATNHPNFLESGPNHSRHVPLTEPPLYPIPTRVEKDLRLLHVAKYEQLNHLEWREPYKSHFQELLRKTKALAGVTEFEDTVPGQRALQEAEEKRAMLDSIPGPVKTKKKTKALPSSMDAGSGSGSNIGIMKYLKQFEIHTSPSEHHDLVVAEIKKSKSRTNVD